MADKENRYRGNTVWMKARGCQNCENCKRDNCGSCKVCMTMPRFGGDGRNKQACKMRRCQKKIAPLQVRSDPLQKTIDMYWNKSEIVPKRKLTAEEIQEVQLIHDMSSKDQKGEQNEVLLSNKRDREAFVETGESKHSDDDVVVLD